MADEEENVETTDQVSGAGEGGDGNSAHSPDPKDQEQNVREVTDSADDSGAEAGSADDSAADSASAAEAAPEPVAPAEPDPLDDLPLKERKRILKSRKSGAAGPTRSGEDRQAEREVERKRKAAQRAKRRAAVKAEADAGKGTGTPPAVREPNQPKTRQGVVVSDKADKTIKVRIDIARRHPVYEKIVRRSRTLSVHDERNEAAAGDTVRVVESRPLSKTKRWRLVEILEKAK